VKNFDEYEPPAIATPQSPASALGHLREHENDVPTHLTQPYSDDVRAHLTQTYSDADTAGQHGLDHPAVFIDFPVLECVCNEQGDAASSTVETSACREGGEVYWILSVRGLIEGFAYQVDVESFVAGNENTHNWNSIFSTMTSSYVVRQPFSQRSQKIQTLNVTTSVCDAYCLNKARLMIKVTVRHMYPGLSSEAAVVGIRHMDSSVKKYRITCSAPKSLDEPMTHEDARIVRQPQTFLTPSSTAHGISISIETPLPGQTLVCGAKCEVQFSIRVDTWATDPCEDLELRVMAQNDASLLQLHRGPIHAKGKSAAFDREAGVEKQSSLHTFHVVVGHKDKRLEAGIWRLSAALYCNVQHVDTSLIVSELNSLMRSPLFRFGAKSLELAMHLLAEGHLENASQKFNAYIKYFEKKQDVSRLRRWAGQKEHGILDVEEEQGQANGDDDAEMVHRMKARTEANVQEIIRILDDQISKIEAGALASDTIFPLLFVAHESPESRRALTMEQGCSGLQTPHILPQNNTAPHDRRGGFAYFTWIRTLECLSAFVERFPMNYEGQLWRARVLHVLGEGGGEDSNSGEGFLKGDVVRWHSTTGISQVQDPEDEIMSRHGVYLSIIALASHDGSSYCQQPKDACLDRLRAFLVTTIGHLVSNGLGNCSEILLVDYNPLHTRHTRTTSRSSQNGSGSEKYLKTCDAVKYLLDDQEVDAPEEAPIIRVLTITETQHDTFYNPHTLPTLVEVGKNVGARRAKGEFILFTNTDDVWANSLGQLFGQKQLRHDVFYVTHRGSLSDHIPVTPHTPALLMNDFIAEFGRHEVTVPSMAFSVGSKWNTAACLHGQVDELPMTHSRPAYGFYFDDAPGDFFLISRRAFHRMRGYPEIPANNYIDGLGVYVAAAHGLRQLVMTPECSIYHQPHARSENVRSFEYLSQSRYYEVCSDILSAGSEANHRPENATPIKSSARFQSRQSHRWNDGNWGLASHQVAETTLRLLALKD
jgi:hypothetical protein